MYCSVNRGDGRTCYTKEELKDMIKSYNDKLGRKYGLLKTSGSKGDLWESLQEKMSMCNDELCWAQKLGGRGMSDKVFRPEGPAKTTKWLTTTDIKRAMKPYMEVYDHFEFLGPVPIDFCDLSGAICNMNIKKLYNRGKRCIGVVFNTDPSNKSGQHWISMFIDMRGPDSRKWEINYFDSFGHAELPGEIKFLINHVEEKIKDMTGNRRVIKKLNCYDDMCTSAIKMQQSKTECGMYSIHFIVERLGGRTWESIVSRTSEGFSDRDMIRLRKYYFRPS